MTRSSADHDGTAQPASSGRPAKAEPTTSASGSLNADESQKFRHEFRNVLHAVLIQVRCAHMALDNEDEPSARKHLAEIEAAVSQSSQLLEKFMPSNTKR